MGFQDVRGFEVPVFLTLLSMCSFAPSSDAK
jgi:hypothetical protein